MLINFYKKGNNSIKIHKNLNYISFFISYMIILKYFSLNRKNFKRNNLTIKYIRLFLFKEFLHWIEFLPYYIYFKPINRFFLIFFLNSFRFSYFIWPEKIIGLYNIYYTIKFKRSIKKNLLKQINKKFIYI